MVYPPVNDHLKIHNLEAKKLYFGELGAKSKLQRLARLLCTRSSCVLAIANLSILPSVRLSHGWISQKRCKLELPNPHRWLPGRL